MMKRTPSRNNRSKGLRVKHVLQIALLLGVCFWLIYQVKHNHDKKKEYDENDEKLLVRRQGDQSLKLGRKDLHPVKDEVIHNEKHEEEEEDENVVEDEVNKHEPTYEEEDEGSKNETEESEDNRHEVRDQREEENKLDAEEQEEDENKSEEMEDERRGVGDDEIDENDQEKTEVGTNRDEEFVDEEKEKEDDEKENENGEGDGKGELVENHNTREAREEHYKGDDASSAVTHDAHTTSTETEALSLENSDVNVDTNKTKPENEATYSDESNSNQKDSDLKVTEGDLTASNATSGIEGGNNTLSNPVDSSNLNETATTSSDKHLEASSNMKNVITEASNNSSGAGVNTLSSSDQNKTVILSESDRSQNSSWNTTISGDVEDVKTDGLVQSQNRVSQENLHDSNSTTTVKTENGDTSAGESSNLGGGESENIRLLASNETRDGSKNESSDASEGDNSEGNSEASETDKTLNVDGTEDEMFNGDTQTGETDEMSDASSANGTSDSVEHDAIDSSDDAKFRTDLDTLPDFRNEGENGDEIASE